MKQEWTKEPPRKSGYYWFKGERQHEITIVKLTFYDGPVDAQFCATFCGNDGEFLLRQIEGFWLGPIPIPAPPME